MRLVKLVIAVAFAAWGTVVCAAVSPEEANKLGTTLTGFGAERSGNADGSIPAYEGGSTRIPADFKKGSGRYPDPFKDDKPLFKIDASNMERYADSLSDGAKALLKRFPDYYLEVYPTRRSAVYPDWVLKNTRKNATNAKLIGEIDGDGIEGAYGGIPFPIPKSGTEVMWNQLLPNRGPRTDMRFNIWFIDSAGRKTVVGDQETRFVYPYYDPASTALKGDTIQITYTTYRGPPQQVGQIFLQHYPVNHAVKDDMTWVYSPGQRRVRLAPEFKYDTPAAAVGGALLFDEIGGFLGRMDRFDFKLVGKREMYIPYNNYKAVFSADVIGPKHLDPAQIRWEKHRVWKIEATLKPGKRHVYSRRTFYFDEDSWLLSLSDNYDASGGLYRAGHVLTYAMYDSQRMAPPSQIYYDLTKGNYVATSLNGDTRCFTRPYDELGNMSDYTPTAMQGSGIR